MKVSLLVVVLFALFLCSFAARRAPKYEKQEANEVLPTEHSTRSKHQVRDNLFQGGIAINGSVSGTLNPGDAVSYIVYLDAHEVADINITFDDYSNQYNAETYFYLGGSTESDYFYGQTNDLITLGSHCPELPAKYLIIMHPYYTYATNYTLQVTKRSPNIMLDLNHPSVTIPVNFLQYGYLGIPISTNITTCTPLVFDVYLSEGSVYINDLYMTYACRTYDSDCNGLKVPVQYMFTSYNTTSVGSSSYSNRFQLYVNCSMPGNYYLYMYYGGLVNVTINMSTGYKCQRGCWTGGICDVNSGVCQCNPGYGGAACTKGGAKRNAVRAYQEISVPTDGTPITFTQAQQLTGNYQLRFDAPISNTSMVNVIVAPNNPTSAVYMETYFYFNLQSYASGSNYSAGGSYQSFYGYLNKTLQFYFGQTGTPWFVFVDTSSTVDFVITAELVDASLPSTSFSVTVPPSLNTITPIPYAFVATSTTMAIQVTETYPVVYGVALYQRNPAIIDQTSGYSYATRSTDVGYGYGHYQVYTSLVVGTTYWISVFAYPGAQFDVNIEYPASSSSCQPPCAGSQYGYCDYVSLTCICRNGHGGANCSAIQLPPNSVTLEYGEQTVILNDGDKYSALLYAVMPPFEIGSSAFIIVNASTDTAIWITSGSNPIAAPVNNPTISAPAGIAQRYYFTTNCVFKAHVQYYLAIAPTNLIGGTVSITVVYNNIPIRSDGVSQSIIVYPQYNSFTVDMSNCQVGAYYITLQGLFNFAYYGVSEPGGCFGDFDASFPEVNDTLHLYGGIAPITNCTTQTIDFYAYSSQSNSVVVNVTVTPTAPCLNNCNGFNTNPNGICTLGGVCQCNYPWIGDDCGTWDGQCQVIPDDLTCKSNTPSSYGMDFFDPEDYCEVQYDSNQVGAQIKDVVDTFSAYAVGLSSLCKNELQQILCDNIKYKCNPQPQGTKLYLPCNGLTWMSRCASQLPYVPYELENVVVNIQQQLQQYPGVFECNPNPFNASEYSTTRSASSSTSSLPTNPPDSSSTTAGNDNAGSHLHAFSLFSFLALAFAMWVM